MISSALKAANNFMQVSPDIRQEGMDATTALQTRVVASYLNGMQPVIFSYNHASMNNYIECASARKNTGGSNRNIKGDLEKCRIFKSIWSNPGQKHSYTKQEFYEMMQQLVDGFEFVLSIVDNEKIPLAAALRMPSVDKMQLSQMTEVVVRRMLIAFDFYEFDGVHRI